MVLLKGHNKCFYAKIWKIILKLSLLPILVSAAALSVGSNQYGVATLEKNLVVVCICEIRRGKGDNLGIIFHITSFKRMF